ncbi:uncharacterized protein B0T23DRAFT_320775 [Neurospora hispaniola]|uniref:Zn(2)-C6 fungal-type domain-containing protein n=1 Tax=Neurospora hispaniola TaxID=588809 RepID=A0AAJ0MP42_9PEZI|nr:hypothetical protein B0T23DRAFT_320775 [Neurospora hispaniola]
MSNDPSVRRLLPQTSQMGAFTFAPPAYQQPPRETQKNYVFVDEHNRHKRLKVMRACEGCRRRKIKCDAATTNTWPCSACIRLKLHCVRPNGFDGAAEPQVYEPPRAQFDSSPVPESYHQQQLALTDHQQLLTHAQAPKATPIYPPQTSFQDTAALYHTVPYTQPQAVPQNLQYAAVHSAYATPDSFPTPPSMHQVPQVSQLPQISQHPSSPEDFQSEYAQQDLADLLGSLKVNEAGTAPYLNSKMRSADDEEPSVEETEEDQFTKNLPPLTAGKIRIPPALMPSEDLCLHYFDLYFTHTHPYVPVLDKNQFYHQWHNNREAISPLILEAIFAIANRLADDAAQGQQWLYLATRHADSFLDVPRLSTLQASLILLKAREQAPKKGYYYRSWMSIVQCVTMAKDLGLDEHYADHQAGRSCGLSPAECQLRDRIWQTIFIVEIMIGTPQGKTDLAVEEETVNFEVPRPLPNGDTSEYHVSRNFVYFSRVVRNVCRMSRVYSRLKRNKEWGIDPEFVQIRPAMDAWLTDLPHDLQLDFPVDGSPPWLPSSFVGNMHSYYHLSIILFYRPQLAHMTPTGTGGQWKQHMLVSYRAAKMLCRLQEGIINQFGIAGLQCMQRGINFTLYAVLACIVLHLVALTSPDPALNAESREYFTRHMRVLEKCMGAWPMPDMQRQIDSVREAFSQDIRKPFVLKPSFPYGSPSSTSHPSPPGPPYRSDMSRTSSIDHQLDTHVQHSHVSYTTHPLSPPLSVGPMDSKSDSHDLQSLAMMSSGHGTQAPSMAQTMPLTDAPAWNPSRIFDQWNAQFGNPQVQHPSQLTNHASPLSLPSSGASETSLQDLQAAQAQLSPVSQQMPQYPTNPVQTFVTPAMWQESVASVYEGGLKRSWGDYDGHMPVKRNR